MRELAGCDVRVGLLLDVDPPVLSCIDLLLLLSDILLHPLFTFPTLQSITHCRLPTMTLYYSLVFGLLVFEMVVFMSLIIPMPFTWKRTLLTFISESPVIAKLQYWIKVCGDVFCSLL